MWLEAHDPLGLAEMLKRDRQVFLWQPPAGLLGPLDQTYAIACPNLFDTNPDQLIWIFNSVKIRVIDRHRARLRPSPIFVDQHKAGAINQIGRAEPLCNAFDQMGLSGAKVAQ